MRCSPKPLTYATRRWLVGALAVGAIAALAACLPGTEPALAAPTFRLVPDATRIVRLDPPGAFTEGGMLVRVALRATNPNPIGLRLAELEGELRLNDVPAAGLRFVGGLELPPRAAADLVVEVSVPLGRIDALVGPLSDAVAGRPLVYRVDAVVGVDVLGVPTRFPAVTIARGEVRQADLLPAAPRVSFDPTTTGVREARFDRVTLAIGLIVDNPGPLGFVLRAPDARLRLGDRDVATVGVPAVRVAARSSATWAQEVVFSPVALGVTLATQLQAIATGGAAAIDIALLGSWELDLGVLGRWNAPAGLLVTGRVD
ncbi:MAG: LEA type 2 family protein [Trueperaceae bacterium]